MQKKCLNPSCGEKFKPGHYGDRQQVCGNTECRKWYKVYIAETDYIPHGVTKEHYREILKAARSDPRKYIMVVTARDSALRKGELLGLTWNDVLDRQGNVLGCFPIRGQWDDVDGFKVTKTKKTRKCYIVSATRKLLQRLYDRTKPSRTERIFPWYESAVWRWFHAIQESIKVVNSETGYPYRFHDLRHARVAELADISVVLAKKVAGHESLKTTMRYSERRDDDYLSDLEKIEKRLSSPTEDDN